MLFYRLIIVITSLVLFGCGGGNSSSEVVASTSSFLDSGTSLTYNSTNASNLAATTELDYFNYSDAASSQNPLEVINAHKAYGYGLTGSGKTIAILDAGFNTSHNELNNKNISQYGTQTAATGVNATTDHGLIVSSVAAGEDDESGMQGVAPGASLHIASYNQRSGSSYYPAHWANATDHASSAVVQNNSWGINYQIDTLKSDINSNSWTNAYGISQKFHSSGFTSNEASANSYITALDNFQDHGVIVYALSNSTSYTDADFQAALPELFSNLEEAWITAVNVEITGSSGNETYTRKSAPCGSTGKYCLGADGFQIVGAAYNGSNTNSYWAGVSGTSFVAPQISGAVAILAEAFPSHTPEQLTDRLLASADNSFYSHDATVIFGNGVSHGYDDEFGHGILDIYAALNPITSSAYTRIYTGKSSRVGEEYQLGNSRLITSNSFGDSLKKGLVGQVGYTYDDLGGGFEYDMSYHINLIANNKTNFNLSEELKNFKKPIQNSFKSKNLNQGVTIGLSTMPIQSFLDPSDNSFSNLQGSYMPYLDIKNGGLGIGKAFNIPNALVLIGASVPIEFNNGKKIGTKKSLIGSIEYGANQNQSLTLMTGISQENDSLLGSIGSNAFSLNGALSTSTFTGVKVQKSLLDNFSLTGIATLANTNMTSPNNSLVHSASDIKSSSFALIGNMANYSKDESLSIYINQPSRVDDGAIAIKTASLADSSRNIDQTIKNVNLESSARQINMGFSYRKNLSEDLAFSLKHLITKNLNHINKSNKIHSSYVGLNFKDIKLGIASNQNNSSIEKQISYAIAL